MSDGKDVNYGPLAGLIGTWEGDKGMDLAPVPDGTEENPFYETIDFAAAGDVENAETQKLAVVRYHQIVRRKSDDEVFHDQVGYWLWDASTNTIVQSVNIPRAVAVLAGGTFTADAKAADVVLEVRAARGDADWGIIQSPFMRDNASTESFENKITIRGQRLSYAETTNLRIYGRSFEHTDRNELQCTSR